ncbi:hypothetical protein Tco_0208271, partial [Tanacetum coccineum]
MGGFHLFADVAKYGRTYNKPVERYGDDKPSVVDNKSVDMSGKYGTCNAGAESVGVSDCNKVYKEAGNEAVMSISVDDCVAPPSTPPGNDLNIAVESGSSWIDYIG